MLSTETTRKIEQFLRDNKLISDAQLTQAKLQSAQKGINLTDALVELRALSADDAFKISALISHTPFIDLTNQSIEENILTMLPKEAAENYQAVPFSITDNKLNVAMLDPSNIAAIDFISKKTGYSVKVFATNQKTIDRMVGLYHEDLGHEVAKALSNDEATEAVDDQKTAEISTSAIKIHPKNIASFVQDAPITRALNTILEFAVNSRASDIHIEPREHELKIRYRIDGLLQETMSLPKKIEPALISRIKILSNLKIDEHRVPQDGQANINVNNHEVDLRIAIAPIAYGEQVVIRLLDKSAQLITLENLGFRGHSFRLIEDGIAKPHGMILSTGPTGSGKTTTMYAIIQKIKNVSINIVTLEDPIEYKMGDINQIQVSPGVGLTFGTGLRSILRQDPNVIMVGEIRDRETADLAVQSALTGHLVLSTLHTNSAAGVLPRLLDMNVEPFLIASTVNVVIGQRLVRKVCNTCRETYQAPASAVVMINRALQNILPKTTAEQKSKVQELGYDNLPIINQNTYTLYRGRGCDQCGGSGFLGRIGIYEVFDMNDAMEKLLLSRATTVTIQRQAIADGMLTMQADGLLKVLAGITTIEEVSRVASDY